ncbi:MAG: PEGA domain-containing protein [Caldisericia bacterium]
MTAIIDYQDYHFEIGIGKEYCTIGSQTREVSKPAVIKNGQTFIPLRLLAEAFGADINWFSESRSILLIFDRPVWGREKIVFEGIPSGAEIKLNYQSMGISPLTLEHMQTGRYMIEVEKEGYNPYSTILDLPTPDGDAARVLYFLERIIPTTTTMKVTSDPEEAYVYVDDVPINKTPCEFDTTPGLHTIKVALNGYPSFTKEVICLAGHDVEVHAKLSDQKEKLSELVHPDSFSGEININETTEIFFDVEIENKLGVAQSFQIECPDAVPVGFDGVYVKTARDEKTSLLTPKIMPGEKLSYMMAVKTDGWVTPGDELKSEIVIYAEDFSSWQFRLPVNVVVTGIEPGATTLSINAPSEVYTGERFDVILNISDVFDLSAVETELIYQSKELEVVHIKKGNIFTDAKNIIFSWYKSSQNEVKIIGPVVIGNNSVIKNNGSLLKLSFKAILQGDSVIDFSKIKLLDSKGEEIKHNVLNSHVIMVLEKNTDEEDGE